MSKGSKFQCPEEPTPAKPLPKDVKEELIFTARYITTPGKGILASDESFDTIGKKFSASNLENSAEARRQYRQMLYSTEQLSQYISGVILHEESTTLKDDQGRTFIELLRSKKVIPGIKVDKGATKIPNTNDETITMGLDDLRQRCQEFYRLGCRFAKWRGILKIGENEPSKLAIQMNVDALSKYAVICQECRIVPIVEPDVTSDGKHDIDKCQQVTQKVLAAQIKSLHDHGVFLEGILLKPNMITPGHDCPTKASPEQVARASAETFWRTVPPAVPGVMFLSGGLSEEEATVNLNAINQIIRSRTSTYFSFSFGRALQNTVFNVWGGQAKNVPAAQRELVKRMQANSLATMGKYVPGSVDSRDANVTLFVAKHVY